MIGQIFRDLYDFFSSKWVVIGLFMTAFAGLIVSLSSPHLLQPSLFFAGIWYTRLFWLLLGLSVTSLLVRGIGDFSRNAAQRGFDSALWQFLTSIPMAITLISLLVLMGLISTFVPQFSFNREVDLMARFGKENFDLLKSMGVFTIFSTWYTYALVGFFVINLCACTWKRLGASQRYVKMPMMPKAPQAFEMMPNHTELSISHSDSPVISQKIIDFLKSKRYQTREQSGQILAEKTRWERFSIDVFHVSLLIAIGALLVTNVYGYDYIQVNYKGDLFSVKDRDYKVRVDDFWSENYPDTERVMDWKTQLSILKNNQVVATCVIEVNSPCTAEGVSIYQAAMGEDWLGGATITFVTAKPGNDPTQKMDIVMLGEHSVRVGDSFTIPEENIRVRLGAFLPDFALLNGTAYSKTQRLLNPAAYLEVFPLDGDKPLFVTWALSNAPQVQMQLDTPYKFIITGMIAQSFTGLELSWDPGMPVAYTAFSIIILTLLGYLFLNHQMIWVCVDAQSGLIRIGGRCRKGDFDEKFDKLVLEMKSSLGLADQHKDEIERLAHAGQQQGGLN